MWTKLRVAMVVLGTALIFPHEEYMKVALDEADMGAKSGGIPIGAVLVHDGDIISMGHNKRMQEGSSILHAEIDCLGLLGRVPARIYEKCTLYTTLSPCPMCSGAIRLYKIPHVVIGENETYMGDEEVLKASGVSVTVLNDERCKKILQDYIAEHPEEWYEDIGEKWGEVKSRDE